MPSYKELRNCRIIINDLEGNFLADTRVHKYNGITNTIAVEGTAFDWKVNPRLLILIFNSTELLEYKGTTRKSTTSSEIEIALYHGRAKEDRKYQRYKLGAPGEVHSIIIKNQKVALNKPVQVTVENISATGVLVAALTNTFQDGSRFQMTVPNNSQNLSMECQVVRIRESSDNMSECGCKIIKVLR